MAMVICVMGESGSGKTTSMRNLDPKQTLYIDCDGKGLSWKGWRKDYNRDAQNYLKTSDAGTIMKAFAHVVDGKLKVKNIIVDTISGIMVDDEMARMKEKNYDKWADLAQSVYGLIKYALLMPDDINVIFVAHSQSERDDSGNIWTRIKTSGRKLDKITLESKFTTVLLAKCLDGKYVFEVHANSSTTKTPLGAFEDMTVPNDIVSVLEVLDDYR